MKYCLYGNRDNRKTDGELEDVEDKEEIRTTLFCLSLKQQLSANYTILGSKISCNIHSQAHCREGPIPNSPVHSNMHSVEKRTVLSCCSSIHSIITVLLHTGCFHYSLQVGTPACTQVGRIILLCFLFLGTMCFYRSQEEFNTLLSFFLF